MDEDYEDGVLDENGYRIYKMNTYKLFFLLYILIDIFHLEAWSRRRKGSLRMKRYMGNFF